jgi:hypothetical protein
MVQARVPFLLGSWCHPPQVLVGPGPIQVGLLEQNHPGPSHGRPGPGPALLRLPPVATLCPGPNERSRPGHHHNPGQVVMAHIPV